MDMEEHYLSKPEKLSQIILMRVSSLSIEPYFMRYLRFQNKFVKNVNIETNEL